MIQPSHLNSLRSPSVFIESVNSKPCSIYTVGLWQKYEHPEIVIVGVPIHVGERLLWDMRNLILLGQNPPASVSIGQGEPYYPIQLEPICDRTLIAAGLPTAAQQYSETFPVLQLFWSDAHGDLAWDQSLLNPDLLFTKN